MSRVNSPAARAGVQAISRGSASPRAAMHQLRERVRERRGTGGGGGAGGAASMAGAMDAHPHPASLQRGGQEPNTMRTTHVTHVARQNSIKRIYIIRLSVDFIQHNYNYDSRNKYFNEIY